MTVDSAEPSLAYAPSLQSFESRGQERVGSFASQVARNGGGGRRRGLSSSRAPHTWMYARVNTV